MARKDHPQAPAAGQPEYSARTAAAKAARQARLAEEMRTNLLKRKAQQRAKQGPSKPADA
jgi:hypothetical protein